MKFFNIQYYVCALGLFVLAGCASGADSVAPIASYTATFSDSLIAVQRLRFANEGSIRENIKEFIKRLVSTQHPAGSKPDTSSSEEQLHKLKKLLDDGLINQEEYDRKKHQILNSL